ncbi:hypothetical protein CAPTEDRAFT_211180 [Capitella teleta]|uniref:G-protein coupled receptors family 1 profile domain-containing protein n=1 Tax=Capitella teleta TaxID=283909 RepID=R7UB70_CAPTE|nr:hypothetical protein CAPTEDRAFT_211180 [Capitella teleta]|eukprot:ELU03239.1 hypothetical protein CAPTEDRAFT_211180 [Capitella teleta]
MCCVHFGSPCQLDPIGKHRCFSIDTLRVFCVHVFVKHPHFMVNNRLISDTERISHCQCAQRDLDQETDLRSIWENFVLHCFAPAVLRFACSSNGFVYTYQKNNANIGAQSFSKGMKSICGQMEIQANISFTKEVKMKSSVDFNFNIQVPPQFHINISWSNVDWGLFDHGFKELGKISTVKIGTKNSLDQTFTGLTAPGSAILTSHSAYVKAYISLTTFFKYILALTMTFQVHDSKFRTQPGNIQKEQTSFGSLILPHSSNQEHNIYWFRAATTPGAQIEANFTHESIIKEKTDFVLFDGPEPIGPVIANRKTFTSPIFARGSTHTVLLVISRSVFVEDPLVLTGVFRASTPNPQRTVHLEGKDAHVTFDTLQCNKGLLCSLQIMNLNQEYKFLYLSIRNITGRFYDSRLCIYGGLALWEMDGQKAIKTKTLCTFEHLTLFTKVYTRSASLLLIVFAYPSIRHSPQLIIDIEVTECMGIDIEAHKTSPADKNVPPLFMRFHSNTMNYMQNAKYWLDLHQGLPDCIVAQRHLFALVPFNHLRNYDHFRLRRLGIWEYNVTVVVSSFGQIIYMTHAYEERRHVKTPWETSIKAQLVQTMSVSNYFMADATLGYFYEILVQVRPTCMPHQLQSATVERPAYDINLTPLVNLVLDTSAQYVMCEKSILGGGEGIHIVTISHPAVKSCMIVEIQKDPFCPSNCTIKESISLVTAKHEPTTNRTEFANYRNLIDNPHIRFYQDARFYVFTTFYNFSEMSITPEGDIQALIFNRKIANSPSCSTNCNLNIHKKKPCTTWHSGPIKVFLRGLEHFPQTATQFSGTWKTSHRPSKGEPRSFDVSGEFENFVIFKPFKWSWNEAHEKCISLNGSLLTLKTSSELERFRYLYDIFQENIGIRKTHYKYYPKAHFLGIQVDPEIPLMRWSDNTPCCNQNWNIQFFSSEIPQIDQTIITNKPRNLLYSKELQWPSELDSLMRDYAGVHPMKTHEALCVLLLADTHGSYEWVSVNCSHKLPVVLVCQKHNVVSIGLNESAKFTTIKLSGLRYNKIKGNHSNEVLGCPSSSWSLYNETCYSLIHKKDVIANEYYMATWHEDDGMKNILLELALDRYAKYPMLEVPAKVTVMFHGEPSIVQMNQFPFFGSDQEINVPDHVFVGDPFPFNKTLARDSVVDYTIGLYSSNPMFKECPRNTFRCNDGSCILISHVCDGECDCLDGEDEICSHLCSIDEFHQFLSCIRDCYPHNCTCSETHFQCLSGACIPFERLCNGIPDCSDSSDEHGCASRLTPKQDSHEYFHCFSDGTQIRVQLLNDLIPDCPDGSDENEFELSPSATTCPSNMSKCHPKHPLCYNQTAHCHYDIDELGHLKYCRNGGHLHGCMWVMCPDEFKCHHSYCIPIHRVCDGINDCPMKDDEKDCAALSCVGLFKCKNGTCLHPNFFCNGQVECPLYADDERLCDTGTCPPQCKCLGRTLICNNLNWSLFQNLSGSVLAFTSKQTTGKPDTSALLLMTRVLSLTLTHGSMRNLPPGPNSLFRNQGALLYLDLSHNQIESLPQKGFYGLKVLKGINLKNNPLFNIGRGFLSDSSRLTSLSLHLMTLDISPGAFRGLTRLISITIKSNKFKRIPSEIFDELTALKELTFFGSKEQFLPPHLFHSINHLELIRVDESAKCCIAKSSGVCIVNDVETQNSCGPLLSTVGRVFSSCWGVEIVSLNMYMLYRRVIVKASPDAILIKSLHLADSLMGLYFCTLAIAGGSFGYNFAINFSWWVNSIMCRFLALLTFASMLVSTLHETLVAIERYCHICMMSKSNPWPGKLGTMAISGGTWAIGLGGSAAIVMGSEQGMHNRLCLVVNYFEGSNGQWSIVTAFLSLLNFVCFVAVMVCAAKIHVRVVASAKEVSKMSGMSANRSNDHRRKLTLTLFAFFFSKLSTLILIVLPSCGVTLKPEAHIFVLAPCVGGGAALNPLLYGQRKKQTKYNH